jgi:hypothetical protein
LADFFALRLAPRLALFPAAFLAGRRADFFGLGLGFRSAGVEGVEVSEAGYAGVAAGVGAGAGVGSEGSGSIHPEPDQPISI